MPSTVPVPKDLRLWNIGLSAVHAIFAVIAAIPSDVSLPVYSSPVQPYGGNGTWGVTPGGTASETSLSLKWMVFSFFAITSFAHAAYGFVFRSEYEANIRECRNPLRWIEYAGSASVMAVSIAYFCTVIWRHTLFAILGLVMTTMGYGHVTEMVSRPKDGDEWTLPLSVRIVPHLIGYIPLVVAFWIIGSQFGYAANLSSPDGRQMPSFVYYIVGTQFFGFFSFGFIQLAALVARPKQFGNFERLYCVLSAVVKVILGLIIFVQVLFRSSA